MPQSQQTIGQSGKVTAILKHGLIQQHNHAIIADRRWWIVSVALIFTAVTAQLIPVRPFSQVVYHTSTS